MTTTSLSEIFQKRLWNILEVKNFKIRAECMSWYLKRCKTLIGICYLSTFKIGSFWICFHRQTNTRWLIHIFYFKANSHPLSWRTRQTPIWAFEREKTSLRTTFISLFVLQYSTFAATPTSGIYPTVILHVPQALILASQLSI